jgi:hypothetical protein
VSLHSIRSLAVAGLVTIVAIATMASGSTVGASRSGGSKTVITGPPNQTEVVLLTAVNSASFGYFQVLPCDEEPGTTSNLNVSNVGQTASALAVVTYDRFGVACVFTSGGASIVVDRQGALGSFRRDNVRLLDTRDTAPARAGVKTFVATLPRLDMLLSVVALRPTGRGYLQVLPCDEEPGGYASVNVDQAGRTTSNSIFYATESPSTDVCVYTTADTDVVIDLLGADLGLVGDNRRLLDTRPSNRLDGGDVRSFAGPAGQSAAVAVTLVDTAGPGYAQILDCGETPGAFASLTVDSPGRVVTGSSTLTFPASGELCVFSSTGSHVVIDLQGTMPSFVPVVDDRRNLDSRDPRTPGSMTLDRTINTPLEKGTCGWISEYLENRLVDGSAPSKPGGGPENMAITTDVVFSDINRDGRDDAAYALFCNGGGTAVWNGLMIHYAGDRTPRELAYAEFSTAAIEQRVGGISFVYDVSINDDLMRLSWDSARFGPVGQVRGSSLYRVDGTDLTLIDWDYTPL